MTDANGRRDRVESLLSRRQAIVGGATLLTAGGSLVWVGDPVRAAVSVEDFAIPDAGFEAKSIDPVVDVTVAYDYDVGSQPVGEIVFELRVDGSVVAREDLRTDRTTLSGETTLSGRITDSDAWTATDFAPEIGASVERDLAIELWFGVRDGEGGVIVKDRATETTVVEVTHPQDSTWTASVGGVGEIRTATQE